MFFVVIIFCTFCFHSLFLAPPLKFCMVRVLLFGVLDLATLCQTGMSLTSFYQTVGPSDRSSVIISQHQLVAVR